MSDRRFRIVTDRRVEGLAPAKLNLFLEVLGRRPDGFHELRTVFHEIDLGDEVAVELAPSEARDRIELSGLPIDGPPEENLALRAAAAFRRRAPDCPAVRIELKKVVPPGSGTGGGSSDAAFVLGALAQLHPRRLNDEALRAAANEIGSDVAFFLIGGTAIGSGRGGELTPLAFARELDFVLLFPSFSLSTATVYAHVDLIGSRADVCSFAQAMCESGGTGPIAGCFNRLESAAGRVEPRLATLLSTLRATSRAFWSMTGSGSALFTIAADTQAATRIAEGVTRGTGFGLRVVRSFARGRGPIAM
jgi:4-diphosphocytidyl-2-C-methyl-D-erythritol kinase